MSETIFGYGSQSYVEYNDAPYELGTIFQVLVPGQIVRVRMINTPNQNGDHAVRIWAGSELVSGPHIFASSGTGWVEFVIPSPVNVLPEIVYTVSIATGVGNYYIAQSGVFLSQGGNGANIFWPTGAGVFGDLGGRPINSFNGNSYFRDIVFVPNISSVSRFPLMFL